MKIVKVDDLIGTDRDVDCPKGGFKSLRVLLESDGMGYTLTKTLIPSGKGPQRWHYKEHLETCFCISGVGILTASEVVSSNGISQVAQVIKHKIVPGTVYVLDKHDDHTFEAIEDVVLICVFNPPLKGREVHKEDGSY